MYLEDGGYVDVVHVSSHVLKGLALLFVFVHLQLLKKHDIARKNETLLPNHTTIEYTIFPQSIYRVLFRSDQISSNMEKQS